MADKTIFLCCSTGASSGFIAKNIRQAAKAEGIEVNVIARSDSVIEDYIEDVDVILIAPHLSYLLDDLEDIADEHDVPLVMIPKKAYGDMDGAAILQIALEEMDA